MATDAEARAAGFLTPYGDESISDGDDAITNNARVALEHITRTAFSRDRIGVNVAADIFNLVPGAHVIHSVSAAEYTENLPEKWPGPVLEVGVEGQPLRFKIFAPYQKSYLWVTTSRDLSGGYMPWWKLGGAPAEAWAANSLHLARMHAHYGGPVNTGGLGAVAWRIDHGFKNFRDKLLPIFRAAGIVPVITYNPRDWSRSENAGVTTSEVNQWVADGWVEISNHGATHADASGDDALEDYVAGSLAEIEAQLPAAKGKVFGFHVPGVGNTEAFDGFGGGSSAADWDTAMGRQILKSHAFGSGHMTGTTQRVLDGTVRNGLLHMATDSRTASQMIAAIDEAIAGRTGLQIMTHPSLVDTAGYNSTATIQAIVDHIVAKRDAGQLAVLSPYQLMLADATRPPVEVDSVDGLAARLAALEYKSGKRNITSLLPGVESGALYAIRSGSAVSLFFDVLKFAPIAGTFVNCGNIIPSGFRVADHREYFAIASPTPTSASGPVRLTSAGGLGIYGAGDGQEIYGTITFQTPDAPPTTPPGDPA